MQKRLYGNAVFFSWFARQRAALNFHSNNLVIAFRRVTRGVFAFSVPLHAHAILFFDPGNFPLGRGFDPNEARQLPG
jgi:hypothetical protein